MSHTTQLQNYKTRKQQNCLLHKIARSMMSQTTTVRFRMLSLGQRACPGYRMLPDKTCHNDPIWGAKVSPICEGAAIKNEISEFNGN